MLQAIEKRKNKDKEEKAEEKEDRPPYCGKEIGENKSKPPAEGFAWRGRGSPESGKGAWVKNHDLPTEESLHPDFDHPLPKKPHWDYEGFGREARLNLDGTWEWK